MTSITLHEGDNRDHLRRLIAAGVRVHSVVTDPPYGLVSITKRFGGDKAAPAKFGSDGAFQRQSKGFMGSKWDGTGIERDPEFWALIHDILLPGGYVLAFASSRTFHRMAVAIEDAGFITHPMLGWVFGSGFPKASDAQRAVDSFVCQQPGRHYEVNLPREGRRPDDHVCDISEEGAAWEGWGYGGQALKPALEPIYVGQRPFDGKTGAPSILEWGVGAINIDGCRVPGEERHNPAAANKPGGNSYMMSLHGMPQGISGRTVEGRHPANLLHDGSDDVVALFPESGGQRARVSGNEPTANGFSGAVSYSGMLGRIASAEPRNDSGSAARFFNAFPPEEPYPVFYQAKAGKADRAGSKHPTVKPVALMRWLCRLVTPPGGVVLDPFAGSGTTAEAARAEGFDCMLMEGDETFAGDIRRRFTLPLLVANDCSVWDDVLGGEEIPELEALLG